MATKEIRTEYDWGDNSVIRHVDVRQERKDHAIAYIYADENPEAAHARNTILTTLRAQGLGAVPDYRNGKFGLRISGLKNGEELISVLTKNDLVKPPITTKTSAPEEAKPKTLWESVRMNSLRAAGVFYSMGNVVYLTTGLLRSKERGKTDYGQISSALIWGSGDILVATIGGHDDSRQFTSLLTKLKHHYVKEGIHIAEDDSIGVETSTKNKTTGSKIYDFLHAYVNPIKCGTEVFAAFGYYNAGKAQGNVWKQRTAVTFGLGFLASLLIPEKKIDEEKYAQAGTLGRLWMKIQSNPLSVGGISGYSNTIFTTVGAIKEGKRYRQGSALVLGPNEVPPSKYYQLDYAAPAVMLFGNSLYAISKKNTGGDIKTQEAVNDVYSIAAQVISKQPEASREAALDSTARFLGERPEIKDTHAQIVVRLKEQMELQKKNPWSAQTHTPPSAQTSSSPVSAASTVEPKSGISTEGLQHSKNAQGLTPNETLAIS